MHWLLKMMGNGTLIGLLHVTPKTHLQVSDPPIFVRICVHTSYHAFRSVNIRPKHCCNGTQHVSSKAVIGSDSNYLGTALCTPPCKGQRGVFFVSLCVTQKIISPVCVSVCVNCPPMPKCLLCSGGGSIEGARALPLHETFTRIYLPTMNQLFINPNPIRNKSTKIHSVYPCLIV